MDDKPQDEAAGDTVQLPELAHVRDSVETHRDETDSDSELEATELRDMRDSVTSTLPRISHVLSLGMAPVYWYDPFKRFWRHQVRITVPHDDCRDHLGKSLRGPCRRSEVKLSEL